MNTINEKPIIGVSACLLGQQVRFDGGHKSNKVVNEILAQHFEFRPFCPELAANMGIPRVPIRLVNKDGDIRAVSVRSIDQDYTNDLQHASQAYCNSISKLFAGYVLKKGSPSCGMERVKLYNESGVPTDKTVGVFAKQLAQMDPLLPLEEEGRLSNPKLLKNFLVRVFVYHHWQRFTSTETVTRSSLIKFHTSHKYLLLSHSEVIYRNLGRVLANTREKNISNMKDQYISELMAGLKVLPTRSTHSNVLFHMAGFFKRYLAGDDKKELIESIENYRKGKQPIIAPITLLSHYMRIYPSGFLSLQNYLSYQRILAQF